MANTSRFDTAPNSGAGLASLPAINSGNGVRQFLIVCFLVLAIIPVYFSLGGVRLSPYRVMLLIAFVPLIIAWLSGMAGRIRAADLCLLAFCFWSVIATFANHGSGPSEFAINFFIESFGAYMLGRVLVRSLDDFIVFAKCLFWILILFIPFGWAEGVTRESVYISVFSPFGTPIAPAGVDIRWGLNRAQVAFEHPILYGMFCASAFSILYHMPRADRASISGLRRAWASIVATFFSLSSGALSPVGVQVMLIMFNGIFRNVVKRWKNAAIVAAIGYVALDLASNRTPFEVIASSLAFSGSTYYWRVLIFEFGIQNVWADPLFGSGLWDWARPAWMHTATVDNFWLVIAMRYGVPGFLLFAAFYVLTCWGLIRAKLPIKILSDQRYGAIFTLGAMALGISTVWLWNSVYVYFLFLIGTFSWIAEEGEKPQPEGIGGEASQNGEVEDVQTSRWTRQRRAQPDKGKNGVSPAANPARSAPTYARAKPSGSTVKEQLRYRRVEPRGPKD